MVLKTYLVNAQDGEHIKMIDTLLGKNIITTNDSAQLGTFKSVTSTSIATTTITEPEGNGSIVLTDLIINAKKSNADTVTIRFSDGTNIINIVVVDITIATNITMPFAGNWKGWKDAKLEVVTSATAAVTVSVGYYKVPEPFTDTFAVWDTKR